MSNNIILSIISIALMSFLLVKAEVKHNEVPATGGDNIDHGFPSWNDLLKTGGLLPEKTATDGYRGRYHDEKVNEDGSEIEEKALLTQRLLVGIEKVFDIFAGYTDELLVDALLGVKISIDQLNATLYQIARTDVHIASTIRRLFHKGLDIMDTALPKTRAKFQDFEEVGSVLNLTMNWERNPTSFSKPMSVRRLDKIDDRCEPPYWSESISDHCISQLLHGKRSSADNPIGCILDDTCVEILLRRCHGYILTHQALFLMIAIKSACTQQLDTKLSEMAPSEEQLQPDSIYFFLDSYCKDIYKESIIIDVIDFPLRERDLFIEQLTVCGLINYVDFFRLDWAEQILGWQQSDGCYQELQSTPQQHSQDSQASSTSKNHHREKRRELVFRDGCSSHTTGLAAAYFSVLLRHITHTEMDVNFVETGTV